MEKEILKLIKEVEKKHQVKIIFAVESGSRAWGFASEDSDYDIRCVHLGKLENYLGLSLPPLQIKVVKDSFDFESWDVKKFATLMLKSNPQIAEWLRSPLIYVDSLVRKKFKNLFDEGCSLAFLKQHYLRMARQNYHKYMNIGRSHSCKKYLYILRGIACANYIHKEKKLPPLPYKEVIPYLPSYVQQFFEQCVLQKNTTEKAEIVAKENVTQFIEQSLTIPLHKINVEFIPLWKWLT